MKIEACTLVEFVQKIEQAVKQGYSIDYDDNASVPVGSIGFYRCEMHNGEKIAALLKAKPEPEPEEQLIPDELKYPEDKPFVPSVVFQVKQPEAVKKAGRPKAQQI